MFIITSLAEPHGPFEGGHGLALLEAVGQLVVDLVLLAPVDVVSVAIAPDPSGEEQVAALEGHALGVESAEVGILKNACEVSLGGLLKGDECLGLEAEIVVEAVADLTDDPLEGRSWDEEVG